MQFALIGATGETGRTTLEIALEHGHTVHVVARNPASLEGLSDRARVWKGDVRSVAALTEAFKGCAAVVSCVGVSSPMKARKGTDVYSAGTRCIAEAMRAAGVARLIVVSSAGVAPRKGAPLIYRLVVKPFFLEPAYRDMREMEAFLQTTDLDWTSVRPPLLTGGLLKVDYRLQADRNFDDDRPLPRASLAHFLVTEVETPRFNRRVVAISA